MISNKRATSFCGSELVGSSNRDDFRIACQGTRDFNQLLGRNRLLAHNRFRTQFGQPDRVECIAGLLTLRCAKQQTTARPGMTQQNVVFDAQIRSKVQLLVDHRDADAPRIVRTLGTKRSAGDRHRAAVCSVGAAQHFQQRAFARAVFANQGKDFAARDGQRNVLKCVCGTKPFADPLHFEQSRIHQVGRLLQNLRLQQVRYSASFIFSGVATYSPVEMNGSAGSP